jgi:uncharacterized protein (TIGR03083 family)
MTKQRSKAELLKDIQVERTRLEQTLSTLTPKDMTRPGVVGAWSVKDVLAHLAAWEQLFLHWYEAGRNGKRAEPTPVGMSRKAMDALNEQIFKRYSRRSLATVLAEFQASYEAILAAIQAVPEDDMIAEGRYVWTGKLRVADYIAGNTCNHYRWATSQIRRWFKER